MNHSDRKRLNRLQTILEAVPFSASGCAITTGYGAIMFEQDMRALRPYIRKIIEGMVLQGSDYLTEGEDFENPDELLSVVEAWINKRKAEAWADASQYSIEYFFAHTNWREWNEYPEVKE